MGNKLPFADITDHPVAESPPPERPALESRVESGSSGLTGDSWVDRTPQPQAEQPQSDGLGLQYSSTVGEQFENIVEHGLSATVSVGFFLCSLLLSCS